MNDDPHAVFYRRNDEDPLSTAQRKSKAQKVPTSDWVTVDASGKLVPTMENRIYTIYRLPPRARCDHPISGGPWALRLGPAASGALGQHITLPTEMAPGIRKASIREVLQVLGNPDQFGYPRTANSDARLGFCTYAY